MKVFLLDLKTRQLDKLSEKAVEVKDDHEYQIIIEVDNPADIPTLSIGDIDVPVGNSIAIEDKYRYQTSITKNFYDNALFLNYFGECQIIIDINDEVSTFIIEVNIHEYKGDIARSMLSFLSSNADDVLMSCYSKAYTGFSFDNGLNNDRVKIKALERALNFFENHLSDFVAKKKFDVKSEIITNSNKPGIINDEIMTWLAQNPDRLELSNKSQGAVCIDDRYFTAVLPNAVSRIDTNKYENHVIHYFLGVAKEFLNQQSENVEKDITVNKEEQINKGEYVKFDLVITQNLMPIVRKQERHLESMRLQVEKLQRFAMQYIPVENIKPAMPVHTAYSTRQKHYLGIFEHIKLFYNAETATRNETEFLLGLRSLSQLFEFCCLYYLTRYFKRFSQQVSAQWVKPSYHWDGDVSEELNVLGNKFVFENENYRYEIHYEKRFDSFHSRYASEMDGNLIRVDKANNYVKPDYAIKIIKKTTLEYYFIILDAKFSRGYKMPNSREESGILERMLLKYGHNLKALDKGEAKSKTRFVGVIYGLANESDLSKGKTKRVNAFSAIHDVDGALPVEPFASADFIRFDDVKRPYYEILDKYIER